jgi:hypothetical protein
MAGILRSIRFAQCGAPPLPRRGPECQKTCTEMLWHAPQMVHPAMHPSIHHCGASHPAAGLTRRSAKAEPRELKFLREHKPLSKWRRERVQWLGVLVRVLGWVHGLPM